MLSFTRWFAVMLTAVVVAGGGVSIGATRRAAPFAADHAGSVRTASPSRASDAVHPFLAATRRHVVTQRELPLAPAELQVAPATPLAAYRLGWTPDDPHASRASHPYDATGPPHRS